MATPYGNHSGITQVSSLVPAKGFLPGQKFFLQQGFGDLLGLFAQTWVVDVPAGDGFYLELADHVFEGMAQFFGGAVHGLIERWGFVSD